MGRGRGRDDGKKDIFAHYARYGSQNDKQRDGTQTQAEVKADAEARDAHNAFMARQISRNAYVARDAQDIREAQLTPEQEQNIKDKLSPEAQAEAKQAGSDLFDRYSPQKPEQSQETERGWYDGPERGDE